MDIERVLVTDAVVGDVVCGAGNAEWASIDAMSTSNTGTVTLTQGYSR